MFGLARHVAWPGTTFSLAWLVAGCNTLGGGKHHSWGRPGRSSFISGELKAGGIAYVYVLLKRSYDPTEGHPGQHAYNFMILILLTGLTSVSIFSVCFYSRYLSLWYSPCADVSSPIGCAAIFGSKRIKLIWSEYFFTLKRIKQVLFSCFASSKSADLHVKRIKTSANIPSKRIFSKRIEY